MTRCLQTADVPADVPSPDPSSLATTNGTRYGKKETLTLLLVAMASYLIAMASTVRSLLLRSLIRLALHLILWERHLLSHH